MSFLTPLPLCHLLDLKWPNPLLKHSCPLLTKEKVGFMRKGKYTAPALLLFNIPHNVLICHLISQRGR